MQRKCFRNLNKDKGKKSFKENAWYLGLVILNVIGGLDALFNLFLNIFELISKL